MKTLDKYIIKEIIPPFIGAFCIISFTLIIGKIVDLITLILGGASPIKVIALVIAVLTASLGFSIPPSFLVGCTVAFGRLSSDMEITAIKSLGISVRRIAMAALALGFFVSIIVLIVNLFIAPVGSKITKGIITDIILSQKELGLEARNFTELIKGITIYAKEKEGDWLKNIMVFDMRSKNKTNIIEAEKGKIKRDKSGNIVFYLKNGRIVVQGKKHLQFLNFKKYTISLTASLEDIFRKPVKRELTFPELIKRLKKEKMRKEKEHYMDTLVHLYKRFALAFSPLVFALIGIPISIGFQRKEKWASFLISLSLFMAYFGILSFSQRLIYQGLPPFISAWLPNIILSLLGILLFIKKIEGVSL